MTALAIDRRGRGDPGTAEWGVDSDQRRLDHADHTEQHRGADVAHVTDPEGPAGEVAESDPERDAQLVAADAGEPDGVDRARCGSSSPSCPRACGWATCSDKPPGAAQASTAACTAGRQYGVALPALLEPFFVDHRQRLAEPEQVRHRRRATEP